MFVDLSVVLNEQTPVYPGDPQIKISSAGVFEKDGYSDYIITFGNHNGTHVDAPSHMIANGKTLDQFTPEAFTGRGVLVDVQKGFSLDLVQNSEIQQADIVLFQTGMNFGRGEYFTKYPAMDEEIARYLVEKKPKMIGIDTCSIDNSEGFPIHKILLKNEILIIENLTNLSSLQNKKVTVYAFPLKFQIDGSPARVVAEIKE